MVRFCLLRRRESSWDPYNAVILSEFDGKAQFEAIIEGVTFRKESDKQPGHSEKVLSVQVIKLKTHLFRSLIKNGRNDQRL